MDYLVPAWHKVAGNWVFEAPQLDFDDVVSQYHLFKDANDNVGLVITDYQPSLTNKLSSLAMSPRKVFSVFDYIQGIDTMENAVLDFNDFNWPDDVFYEFTPFHLIVRNGFKVYAQVYFGTEGQIVWLEDWHLGRRSKTLFMDSRGFVSRVEYYDKNNQETKAQYVDPMGHWRIEQDAQTGHVRVNPVYQPFFLKSQYENMNELIKEVLQRQFMDKLKTSDRLIVSVDDDSKVPQSIYAQVPVIYSVTKWHDFSKSLDELKQLSNINIVTDTKFTERKVTQQLNQSLRPMSIPLFHSLFKLGHSQRDLVQKIVLFADNIDEEQLMSLTEIICHQMLKDPENLDLTIISYDGGADARANDVVNKIKKRHLTDFVIKSSEDDKAENQFPKAKPLPILSIKNQRFFSTNDLLKTLDSVRLIVDWGDHPDDFLQMAAVSVGIPCLQRVGTDEIHDQQNGLICEDLLDLRKGLTHYLDSLKNWNAALANDVQILNRNSADQLQEQWQIAWKRGREEYD